MSKKIKPNELKMINDKSDSHKSSGTVKAQGDTGQSSKTKTGIQSDATANKLKRKIPTPIEASSKGIKKMEDRRVSVTKKSNLKTQNSQELNRTKSSPASRSAITPMQKHKSTVDKVKSSVKITPNQGSEKRSHFPLNPYAIDPSDPLIKGDALNISSYIGNLFGYSKDR